MSSHCRNVMADRNLIEKMKNENVDLAITEPFDMCGYEFFEAISVRAHVAVYSCSRLDHVTEIIGQPTPLSYVPGAQSAFGEKMNIWERFMNFFQFKGRSYIFQMIGDADHEAARESHPNLRSWRETLPEASFIFTNSIPYLDFPAPTFDKMIPIGGFTVKTDHKSLKLDEKWSRILNERTRNVLISFGTNARSEEMPIEYKWIPLAADQSRNSQMLKKHGGAVVLSKFDLANPVKVSKTIETVLSDPKYQKNADRLAEILHNQPINATETLIKYIEFAAKFGKLPSLDNQGRHQSFIQYFFLDIIAIISLTSLISLYISYRIVNCAFRKCFGTGCSRSESKSKKE
uniref:glucuronosyltransferase n=1 Tax=Caenorhabditis tropicalis TaxID=1561998 RepID=A0A1I7UM40_9PELO